MGVIPLYPFHFLGAPVSPAGPSTEDVIGLTRNCMDSGSAALSLAAATKTRSKLAVLAGPRVWDQTRNFDETDDVRK